MTPPTPEQVAALEQWARESLDALDNLDVHGGSAHQHCNTTLALIASWREGQEEKAEVRQLAQALADATRSDPKSPIQSGVSASYALTARYAERLERAEAQRDAALADLAQARQERDEARAAVATGFTLAERDRLESDLVQAVHGLKNCDMLARRALAAATRDGMAKHLPHILRICEAQAPDGTVMSSILRATEAKRPALIYTVSEWETRALEAEATIATLRAALTAAQELLELPETCVVCSAILEPREDEAPHCYDCVVTDEHEAERQDRITQLEIALAQAAPAQEGQR